LPLQFLFAMAQILGKTLPRASHPRAANFWKLFSAKSEH
jgi:hypothetical protein